jgi:hypothetical protein
MAKLPTKQKSGESQSTKKKGMQMISTHEDSTTCIKLQ